MVESSQKLNDVLYFDLHNSRLLLGFLYPLGIIASLFSGSVSLFGSFMIVYSFDLYSFHAVTSSWGKALMVPIGIAVSFYFFTSMCSILRILLSDKKHVCHKISVSEKINIKTWDGKIYELELAEFSNVEEIGPQRIWSGISILSQTKSNYRVNTICGNFYYIREDVDGCQDVLRILVC